MFDLFGMTNIMFSILPVFVVIIFIVVLGLIVSRLIKGAQQWKRNNESPVLTVEAHVVTKRSEVSHYHHANTTG